MPCRLSFNRRVTTTSAARSLACLGLALAVSSACDGPSGDVREWTAADHDQPASAPPPAAGPARPSQAGTDPALVEVAWQNNCTRCHGPHGRGDGPESVMYRVADLTRPDWQAKVSDEEIAETIRRGRNKMPPFDLPPGVLDGLVKRIRAAGGVRARDAGAPPPDAGRQPKP